MGFAVKAPATIVTGCALSGTVLMVAGILDELPPEEPFTRLFYLNVTRQQPWDHADWPERSVVSVCRQKRESRNAGCSLTGDGHVEIANADGVSYENISGAGLGDESRFLGDLLAIKEIGSTLFACGGGGQVYRRTDGEWIPIDRQLAALTLSIRERIAALDTADISTQMMEGTRLTRMIPTFGAIDGSAENDLYVCGIGGNLFHYDGLSWSQLDSHTDLVLHDVHVASIDDVWLVGQEGTVLRGNARSGFRPIGELMPGSPFWSVRAFRGETFVSSSHGLFRLFGDRLVQVRESDLTESDYIVTLDTFGDEALWITTHRHAYRYDGASIQKYPHPDNL